MSEAKDVHFVDTTFRDGSQSLWAMGIRHGQMEAIAGDMDRAGYEVIEIPGNAVHFKKMIRDLKENPWDTMHMLAEKIPNTPKSCMSGGFNLNPLGRPTPPALGELFWTHQAEIGALQRVQMMSNTADQMKLMFPALIPFYRSIGIKFALAIAYCISPRHTDDLFAEQTRRAAALKPDVIYLKDQGGLLTLDRVRTLVPMMMEICEGIPFELHSHCTTGMAPMIYLEALELGVETLHTGIPPLAEGSAQPSVLNVAHNARLKGFSPLVDETLLQSVSERFYGLAKEDDMVVGEHLEYDYGQFIHQIPGGVISNLRFQLAEIGLGERLDEVIEESIRIREELGYPFMITPYSQHMCTQAALNVSTGERYSVVIDDLIRFAHGTYGEDSGEPWMDQDLKDRLLADPRAAELAPPDGTQDEPSVKEYRDSLGLGGASDEELLMHAIMQGDKEIDAMRAAGPPKQYLGAALPLKKLMRELNKHPSVRYVQVQRGDNSLLLRNAASG
ncbi:MAG: hypothetical protein QF393_07500 [Rhodospirillales bacterium]|nr:hypothetical protein [Rhodospirillaceae bacterium]MDP6427847.1 hypothetical protein [Rhodospirillales bacterium]MDP6643077.1 hypothetical protein [Rhodospirillales bacterium]